MTQRIFLAGFACALFPAIAVAQADVFSTIDTNRDRSVSMEEWYALDPAPVPFSIVDLDGDRNISLGEFRSWQAARGGSMQMGITTSDRFRATDRNRDDTISQKEWGDRFPFVGFDPIDANRDRRISYQEFAAWDDQRGGAGGGLVTAAPSGTAPNLMADRLRALDTPRGGVGPAGPIGPSGLPGPVGVGPSSPTYLEGRPGTAVVPRVTPETSPVTGTLSTSPGAAPGVATPALGTGSGLTTR